MSTGPKHVHNNNQTVPTSETATKIVQENIQDLVDARKRIEQRQTRSERLAGHITRIAGAMWFAYLHIAWFAIWICWNVWRGEAAADPFPFGLLTTIVSLEAIFLTLMVLVSQNREAKLEEQRADLDLQIDLLSERELTKVLCIVDAIAKKLGADLCDVETRGLQENVRPRDLLQQLERHSD